MANSRWVSGRFPSTLGRSPSSIGSSRYCETVASLPPGGRSRELSELLLGRDPDNLPLGFVYYTDDKTLGG